MRIVGRAPSPLRWPGIIAAVSPLAISPTEIFGLCFQGHLSRLTPGPLSRTFTRPDAAVARDLFGREDWEPSQLDGQLKDVVRAIRTALT